MELYACDCVKRRFIIIINSEFKIRENHCKQSGWMIMNIEQLETKLAAVLPHDLCPWSEFIYVHLHIMNNIKRFQLKRFSSPILRLNGDAIGIQFSNSSSSSVDASRMSYMFIGKSMHAYYTERRALTISTSHKCLCLALICSRRNRYFPSQWHGDLERMGKKAGEKLSEEWRKWNSFRAWTVSKNFSWATTHRINHTQSYKQRARITGL